MVSGMNLGSFGVGVREWSGEVLVLLAEKDTFWGKFCGILGFVPVWYWVRGVRLASVLGVR